MHGLHACSSQVSSAMNPLATASEVRAIAAAAYERGASSKQVKAEVEALMAAKKKTAELIVVMQKRDKEKGWYELLKTKGVGDSEYHKLVPDSGDAATVTL